jgi:hypothetical protein
MHSVPEAESAARVQIKSSPGGKTASKRRYAGTEPRDDGGGGVVAGGRWSAGKTTAIGAAGDQGKQRTGPEVVGAGLRVGAAMGDAAERAASSDALWDGERSNANPRQERLMRARSGLGLI